MATALRKQKNFAQLSRAMTTLSANEHVPDLVWPASILVYEKMRRDPKGGAILRAMTLPITSTGWHVTDSPDVDPNVTRFVRNELGLNEVGTSRQRRRGQGISWDKALREALLMLPFGSSYFEPVFAPGPPSASDTGMSGTLLHLQRLFYIPPTTIAGFDTDTSGDLNAIRQIANDGTGRYRDVVIPADRLCWFINEQEGTDWVGTSVLRTAFKPWFLKDKLERLAAVIVERNGMGVPVATFVDDGAREETLRAATTFRAGEFTGLAMPAGSDLKLLGVTGSTVDPLPLIQEYGQEMARSVLAMFLDLGHDNGARALGDTFLDFFTIAVNSIISTVEEFFTEGLVRKLVALNFGDNEPYPEIHGDDITPQSPLTANTIALLQQAGVLNPDPTLEAFIRQTFGMPPVDPNAPSVPVPQQPPDLEVVPVAMSGVPLTLSQREAMIARMRSRT